MIDILAQHRRERRIAALVFVVLLLALGGIRVGVQSMQATSHTDAIVVAP